MDKAAALPIATSTPATNLRQYINSDLGYNDLKFQLLCSKIATVNSFEVVISNGLSFYRLHHRSKGLERLSCSAYPIRKVPKIASFWKIFSKPRDLKAGSFLINEVGRPKVANFGSKFRTLFLIPHTLFTSVY